jgi:hypothetical protein
LVQERVVVTHGIQLLFQRVEVNAAAWRQLS